MKIITYSFYIILGALLIGLSLRYQGANINRSNVIAIATASNSPATSTIITSSDTVLPMQLPLESLTLPTQLPASSESLPIKPPTASEQPAFNAAECLRIRNTVVSFGEYTDSFIKKLGLPNRILDTEYDFDWYVYNNDYKRLIFLAVMEGEIVGFYTDSEDFEFYGITYGLDFDSVSIALDRDYVLSDILNFTFDKYDVKVLIDKVGTKTVTGIYVLLNTVETNEFNTQIHESINLQVFDLTNSIRARNNLPLLTWSSSAARASEKHSISMAENNFFSHISPNGKSPGDRLREAGISYRNIGENIIAGYGTAILSSHSWFNSHDHRSNILNSEYKSLGVGFTYQPDSTYITYITETFYR
ncbi:MAG TPA: CAP domain-containing protein [Mobilitalea sp.]|nr:CAP domain-containing protein [Mobilitalea sp.]